MDETNYDNYFQVHPALRKFITQMEMNSTSVLGIPSGNIEILKLSCTASKNDELNDIKYANRITLNIPYAGHFLKWEVIFRNDNLSFAPDLDLFNDDFLNEYDANELSRSLPSWAKWDAKNPKALNDLIDDLIKLYKTYQISLLNNEKYSRLLFEYTSLLEEIGVDQDNVEIIVHEHSKSVVFLMSLDVDTSALPPQLQLPHSSINNSNGKQQAAALLMVTFQQRIDGSQTQHPQLFLASYLEYALGGTANKHIPPFPAQGCLLDYVPAVRKLLEDKIQFVCDNFHLKRKYIAHLLAVHLGAVLEYDSVLYTKATLLLHHDNFYYLLFITISGQFPREKPKYMLRSIYHMSHGKLINEALNDYPYSPRWTPQEMIQRVFKYIVDDKLIQFRNKSIQKNT